MSTTTDETVTAPGVSHPGGGAPPRETPAREVPTSAGPRPPAPAPGSDARPNPFFIPGTALTIVSVVLAGICLQIGLIGHLSYARSQQIAYDDFRYALAQGTAPTGPSFLQEPDVDELAVPSETPTAGPAQPSPAQPTPTQPTPTQPTPTELLLADGTPVALMSIPAIGIRDLVIIEDTTSGVMQDGPGHDRRTVLPGQVGWSQILGRRWAYGAPFRDVPLLRAGDDVIVTTGQGQHRYEVTGLRVAGDRVPVREAEDGRLVLVTAIGRPFVPQRTVYVDAILKTPPQPAGAKRVIPLNPAAEPMAGDGRAWFTLVFWLQGLALAGVSVAWARSRWGGRQTWVVGVPLLAAVGMGTATSLSQLLPNLL